MEFPKRYDPHKEEPKIQQFWKDKNIFAFTPQPDKPAFTIDTPPPTLSGRMHMGHAFSYTQGDFIARFKRMMGDAVFYPFGTDDNGLPTERLIEKQQNISAKHMERSEFREKVLTAVADQIEEFSSDWVRLGISADFDHAYSTIDEHSRRTSQKSFIDLYNKGYLERKKTPISWCTKCQTAIAQAEFENVEKNSFMNTVAFSDGDGNELLIMTTRPELIPACVALAAHPQDVRYKDLKDVQIHVPLHDFTVPIIYDEKADPEKGTGLMMVCTFGDKEDVEKWFVHNLDMRIIFTEDGKLIEGTNYAGLKIKEAREKILADLEEKGLLKERTPLTHAVNVHERCGTEIEFMHTQQWFVNILDHKEKLLKIGESINWFPAFMHTRYQHWVENLNWDWCISRQRPYGVPFPVWYDEQGNVVLAHEQQLPVDPTEDKPKGHEGIFTPETDVMDTWATSSVSPQIALNWAEDPESFNKYYPMSVRLQAHDIIRTWAFYTIAKGTYHHGKQPWNDIVISGHALDPKGKKMSKSKGNTVDPNEIVAKYSADALRFWAASTKLGEDLPYQEKDIVTGHKTINKLWNASRFAMMHLEDFDGSKPEQLETIDEWMLEKCDQVIRRATESFEKYEYSKTKSEVENFFWNVFASDYLEFVKDRLYNPDARGEDARKSGQYTVYTVLLSVLKLWAPIMPHITESIYQHAFKDREAAQSIHISSWPTEGAFTKQPIGDVIQYFVEEVRKYKSENQLSMRTQIPSAAITLPQSEVALFEQVRADFLSTTGIQHLSIATGDKRAISIK